MIEFTKAYKTSDGETFSELALAQRHEIELLIAPVGDGGYSVAQVAVLIRDLADKLVDILTTTPNSKPKARAANGGTKKRRTKAEMAAAANLAQEILPK